MARSEAQRAADKRYAAKVKDKYDRFIVYLKTDENAHVDAVIAASGMTKADFLRWAIREWEKNNQQ